MAVASSSAILTWEKYNIFLSFRSEDTLNTFVCHLLDALRRKKSKTYISDDTVEKGNDDLEILQKELGVKRTED